MLTDPPRLCRFLIIITFFRVFFFLLFSYGVKGIDEYKIGFLNYEIPSKF